MALSNTATTESSSDVARKASKRWREQRTKVDRDKVYSPLAAITLLKELGSAKFDEAVEAHFNLGLDVRKADQMLRSTLTLPNGIGKTVTVAVFAQGEKAIEAEKAGADWVGNEELEAKIAGGWTDFDVCIATPDMMATVGKLGRILGPRGKMPNPKTGTVTFDVGAAVEATKGGKFEYRTDRTGIVHVVIGRKSFSIEQLVEELRRHVRGDLASQALERQGPLRAIDLTRHDDVTGRARRLVDRARLPGRRRGLIASAGFRDIRVQPTSGGVRCRGVEPAPASPFSTTLLGYEPAMSFPESMKTISLQPALAVQLRAK